MKKAALLLGGLLLSAFVAVPASAEVVRVRLTARVTNIDDPGNVLNGKIVYGQRVTGLYVYNTNTPNRSTIPNVGEYWPYANEARLRFAVGSLVFESKQPSPQGIRIVVQSQASGYGAFNIESNDNKPLADGSIVYRLSVNLFGNGNLTETIALPKVAPNLQGPFYTKEVAVNAGVPQGPAYGFRAIIEAAELVVPDAIVVSPASGTFAANQHFDAAVILPRNSVVSTAQASANGVTLPLSYPGSCQLQPQVGTGKPSLLCPAADNALFGIPAGTPIDWTVTLTNGTVYTESVNWERAP
jgi:hypothetical protein